MPILAAAFATAATATTTTTTATLASFRIAGGPFGYGSGALGGGRVHPFFRDALARVVLAAAGRRVTRVRQVLFEIIRTDEIFDVEERGALLANVDEGRLHSGEHTAHFPEVDVPKGAAVGQALDVELGDDSVFNEGDSHFANVDVDDEQISAHFAQFSARARRAMGRAPARLASGRALKSSA